MKKMLKVLNNSILVKNRDHYRQLLCEEYSENWKSASWVNIEKTHGIPSSFPALLTIESIEDDESPWVYNEHVWISKNNWSYIRKSIDKKFSTKQKENDGI